jgi:hypothetical protein
VSVFDETVTIFSHWKLSVLSLIRAFMGARMRSVHAGTGHQNSLEGCSHTVRPGSGEQHTNHPADRSPTGYAESGRGINLDPR